MSADEIEAFRATPHSVERAPLEVVKKLNDATSQAIDTPAIKSRLHELGVTGVALERRSPEYLAKFVVDEIARWAGPIKSNGLQVD
jgi:tripartite-type tricarboxylate transporter receptor subunit TctC